MGSRQRLLWTGLCIWVLYFTMPVYAVSGNTPKKALPAYHARHSKLPKTKALSWQHTALVGGSTTLAVASVSEYFNSSVAAVAIGGALGSVTRYMVSQGVGGWLEQDYPYGTVAVNVIGSFVFGMVSGWAGLREETPEAAWLALVTTGFLGGFTTFSLFAYDAVDLAHEHGVYSATLYTMLSVGVSVVAVLTGEYFGSTIAGP